MSQGRLTGRSNEPGKPGLVTRRGFFHTLLGTLAATTAHGARPEAGDGANDGGPVEEEYRTPAEMPSDTERPLHERLPVWRGFNLLEKFNRDSRGRNNPYSQWDFDFMAEWGFDFVRLPMDYRIWTESPGVYREDPLKDIDAAVSWGRSREIHVCLNLHRAPGYCVNPPKEELDLWSTGGDGREALEQFKGQWKMFAERYRGIPPESLSFNLLNEPAVISGEIYRNVCEQVVAAIREIDPDRLIIADGTHWARKPVPELVPLRLAQSTRGYDPMTVSHHRAPWVKASENWPVPDRSSWSKEDLWEQQVAPWVGLAETGVGVHVGEWGAYSHTPHDVVLAWMKDCLENWRRAGFGWALWNLRGGFGPVDSRREDVEYEDFRGHRLDRAMLEVLLAG